MIELVYVTAAWCAPCKSMKPIIKEIEATGTKVTEIDADKNLTFSRQNGVYAIPTFMIMKDGLEVNRLVGAKSKEDLMAAINLAKQELSP